MSRVGKMPVTLPTGVTAEQTDHKITVKGPKGELSGSLPADMLVRIEAGQIVVERPTDNKQHRCLHGLTRSLIANMVKGVTDGYERVLQVHGVGYRVQEQGNKKLILQIGFSHPVAIEMPPGVECRAETFTPTADNEYLAGRITLAGIDKHLVGQTAAQIRAIKKPEPYKSKGIRYQGERVRRKAGKAAQAGKTGKV